jgi:capsular polysaccharide biosynthesis protein
MSRLPRRLQGLWPVVKRLHRTATAVLGAVFRRTSRMAGTRALPTRATERSVDTAAQDPAHVTVHPGGPAEELVRPMPVGEPADHAAFEPWLRRTVSARYVLEVRDGLLVGDYAATVAPGPAGERVLDYETSGYFGISGWREHPVFLRPRLPEPRPVPGTLLSLATRGTTTNYYHFLTDLLPRWGIFEEAMPDTSVDAVYLGTRASYQRQLLELVGLDAMPVVEVEKNACLAPERLLVPSTPNQDLMAPHWVVDWLRTRLPPSPDLSGYSHGLYVTRGDVANTRRYVEEPELWPALEERGFTRLDPGSVSVREQIDRFAAAEVIVAPHGAALANLVFARAGVRVLELFAPDYVNPCYWAITDAVPDARYHYLVAGSPDEITAAEHKPMTGVLRDISIPPARVLAALDALLGD